MLKSEVEVKMNTKAFEELVKRLENIIDKFDKSFEKSVNKLINEMSKNRTINCGISVDEVVNELSSILEEALSNDIYKEDSEKEEGKITVNNDLLEVIAEAVHNAWWEKKKQGVTDHPDMIPYNDLAENIKEYDRVTAQTVINALNNFNVINNDDWIKPSERLPEYGERVLISLDNFVCEATYEDSIFRRDDIDDILGEKVLAWMHLPKPYSN